MCSLQICCCMREVILQFIYEIILGIVFILGAFNVFEFDLNISSNNLHTLCILILESVDSVLCLQYMDPVCSFVVDVVIYVVKYAVCD